MMKKIVSTVMAFSMLIALATPLNVSAGEVSATKVEEVQGIARNYSSEMQIVESSEEFNCLLENVELELYNSNATLAAEIEGSKVHFTPMLYQNQLGYNAENSLFGISNETSEGISLLKFSIEKNADYGSLLKPNLGMAGNTVVSLAFYKEAENKIYYFQFVENTIQLPDSLPVQENNIEYELANFSAKPYDVVKEEFTSLNESYTYSNSIEDSCSEIGTAVVLNEKTFSTNMENSFDVILEQSTESKKIDQLLEISQKGPIILNPNNRALVEGIPDSVYRNNFSGWENKHYDEVNEGANAKRSSGYLVYHMPNPMSGNIMNYALRFEAVTNFNWYSQQFIQSFIITHNVWIEYVKSMNYVYVFENRPGRGRIVMQAEPFVETTTTNGYFTHYQQSSVSQGNTMLRVARSLLSYVPYLGAALAAPIEFIADPNIRTGEIHPTQRFAKKLVPVAPNLRNKGDHATIVGIGTGIDYINYGYTYYYQVK